MGMAKSDFLRYNGADQIWLKNAERFVRIDQDRSRFVRFWKNVTNALDDISPIGQYQLGYNSTLLGNGINRLLRR